MPLLSFTGAGQRRRDEELVDPAVVMQGVVGCAGKIDESLDTVIAR